MKLTYIGVTTPNCPYCNSDLQILPQRKTKCPICGKQIYSRKRPVDEAKVLLREDQLKEIEKEWSKDYMIKQSQPRTLSPKWQEIFDAAYRNEPDQDPIVENEAHKAFEIMIKLISSGMSPRDASEKAIQHLEGDFKTRVDRRLWQLKVNEM